MPLLTHLLSAVLVPDVFEGKHKREAKTLLRLLTPFSFRRCRHPFEDCSARHNRRIEGLVLVGLASGQVASGQAACNVPSLVILPQTRPEERSRASPSGRFAHSGQGRSVRILLWRRCAVACTGRTQEPHCGMLFGSSELPQARSTRPSANQVEHRVRGGSGRPLHLSCQYPSPSHTHAMPVLM